jgi:hypothetical protein
LLVSNASAGTGTVVGNAFTTLEGGNYKEALSAVLPRLRPRFVLPILGMSRPLIDR